MTPREITEKIETQILSEFAALSVNTRGRDKIEIPCNIRTDYQRDRDRIIHSKSFRRLKHKTQVFIFPKSDHFRTRLTHTLEVSQLARNVARAMRLNEDLTEAIALGHDIGHPCFGHAGEYALNLIHPAGFVHASHSVRVVEVLEKNGKGLNLTKETRDGILNHSKTGKPNTTEGRLVRICDRIAYLNHDIDDAIRANTLHSSKIAAEFTKITGETSSKRINTFVISMLKSSSDGFISMEPKIQKKFDQLYDFMYENVYTDNKAKKEELKIPYMFESIYNYFIKNLNKLPYFLQKIAQKEGKDRAVCDYIAGMTDRYAINIFENIFIPKSFTF